MRVPGVQSDSVRHAIEAVVQDAQRAIASNPTEEDNEIELEVRFGRVTRDGFVPGMSTEQMDSLETAFDACRDMKEVRPWHMSHVFEHPSSIPGDRRPLRTVVTYRSATSKTVASMEKRSLSRATFRVDRIEKEQGERPPIDMRVSAAVEYKVDKDNLPLHTPPTQSEIRARKEYHYIPEGSDRPMWAFHLTKRWRSAKYLQTVCETVARPPQCDLEIEVDSEYVFNVSDKEVAFKILWKVFEVFSAIVDADLGLDDIAIRQV